MNLTVLTARVVRNKKELAYISMLNRREGSEKKVYKQITDQLSEEEKLIDYTKTGEDYELVPLAMGKNYVALWEEKHKTNQAYFGFDGLPEALAIEFTYGFEKGLPISIDDFAERQYDFFCGEFDEENVLSVMVNVNSESNPHVHILVYPVGEDGKLDVAPYFEEGVVSKAFASKLDRFNKEFGWDQATRKILYAKEKKREDATEEPKKEASLLDNRYTPTGEREKKDDQIVYYDAKKTFAEKSVVPIERQEEILDELLFLLDGTEKALLTMVMENKMTKEAFMKSVDELMKSMGVTDPDEVKIMETRVNSAIFKNYVLDPLIEDPSITDIKVLGPNNIRVKQYGERKTSNLSFRGMGDYKRFLKGIAWRFHTELTPERAVQRLTDTKSSKEAILRINITTNYINSAPCPYFYIRKVFKDKYTIEDLIKYGMMDANVASYLLDKVKMAKGILFTGASHSGKTTIMNTLLDHISFNNSVLVIQEAEELFSDSHPDIMFEHVVYAAHPGEPEYTLKDLAKNGLLTDIDYFVIGEIKGEEAKYFADASETGHQCWATVHSESAKEALWRMADLISRETNDTLQASLRKVKSMEVIVYMKNWKVYEIQEISGWDYEKNDLIYRPVYFAPDHA